MFHPEIYQNPSDSRIPYYLHQQQGYRQVSHVRIGAPQENSYHRFVPQGSYQSPPSTPTRAYSPQNSGFREIRIIDMDGEEKTIVAKPLYRNSKHVFLLPDSSVTSTVPENSHISNGGTFSISRKRVLEIVESSISEGTPEKVGYALKIITGYLSDLIRSDDGEIEKKLVLWTSSFLAYADRELLGSYFTAFGEACTKHVESCFGLVHEMIESNYFEKLPGCFHTIMHHWVKGSWVQENVEKVRPLMLRYVQRMIECDLDHKAKLFLDHIAHIQIVPRNDEYFHLNYLIISKVEELSETTVHQVGSCLLNITACDMSEHEEWVELFPFTLEVIQQLLSMHAMRLTYQWGYAKLPAFLWEEIGEEPYPWARPLALKLLIGLSNQQLNDSQEKELNLLFSQNLSCLQDLDRRIPEEKYLECIRSQPIQERCLLLFELLENNFKENDLEVAHPRILEILKLFQEDQLPMFYYSRLRKVLNEYVGKLTTLTGDASHHEAIISKLHDITHQPLDDLYQVQTKEQVNLVAMILDILDVVDVKEGKESLLPFCVEMMLNTFDALPKEHMDPIIQKHSLLLMEELKNYSGSTDHVESLNTLCEKVVNHILETDCPSIALINFITALDLTSPKVLHHLLEHAKQNIPVDLRESIWSLFLGYLAGNKSNDASSEELLRCFSGALEMFTNLPTKSISRGLSSPINIDQLNLNFDESQLANLKHLLFESYAKIGSRLTAKSSRHKQTLFFNKALEYRLEKPVQKVTCHDMTILRKYVLKGSKAHVMVTIQFIDHLLEVKGAKHEILAPVISDFVTTLQNTRSLALDSYDSVCKTLLKAHQKITTLHPFDTAVVIDSYFPPDNIVTETTAKLLKLELSRTRGNRVSRKIKTGIRDLLASVIPNASILALVTLYDCLDHRIFTDRIFHHTKGDYTNRIFSRLATLASQKNVSFIERSKALDILIPQIKGLKPGMPLVGSCVDILHQVIAIHGKVNEVQDWVSEISSFPVFNLKFQKQAGSKKLSMELQQNLVRLFTYLMVEENNNPKVANQLFKEHFTALMGKKSTSLQFLSSTVKQLARPGIYKDPVKQKDHHNMVFAYLNEVNVDSFLFSKQWGVDEFFDIVSFIKESGEDPYIAYTYLNYLVEVSNSTEGLLLALDHLITELFVHETSFFETRRLVLTILLGRILGEYEASLPPLSPEVSRKVPHIFLVLMTCPNSLLGWFTRSDQGGDKLYKKMLMALHEAVEILMNSSSPRAQTIAYELFDTLETKILAKATKNTRVTFRNLLDLSEQHGLQSLKKNEDSETGIKLISDLHLKHLRTFQKNCQPAFLAIRSKDIVEKYASILGSGHYDRAAIWCKQMQYLIFYLKSLVKTGVFHRHPKTLASLEVLLLKEVIRMRRKFGNIKSIQFLLIPIFEELGQVIRHNTSLEEPIQNQLMDILEQLSKNMKSERDKSCLMSLIFISKKQVFSSPNPRFMKLVESLKKQ